MELCSDNLKNIIEQKQRFFRNNSLEPMKPIEYFISCQLFEEVVECVKYLHDSNIMHRDLKPENILINKYPNINNKFIKLCDFDLAKFASHAERSHTANLGTTKYMAKEVERGAKYNFKCDIYSMGEIAIDLFEFNIYE